MDPDLPELAEYVMGSDVTPEERHAVVDGLIAIATEVLRDQTWRDDHSDAQMMIDRDPAPAPSHHP